VTENIRFFLQIFGWTFLLLAVSVFSVNYFGGRHLVAGVVYGYLISLVNVLFAFFSIKWAFNKSNKTFFTVVLGGMGMRFLILMIAIFFVWRFAQIPFTAFIISLIGFYLTLQVFEIRFIQKKLLNRKALSS